MAEGYLYYVSFAGITGAAKLSVSDIAPRVRHLRDQAEVPVAVGFGIKDAASAKAVAAFADAVVIGSALVATLAEARDSDDVQRRASQFLTPIRTALDAVTPA
jgi:tryptophan synthase alpha chain